MHNKNQNFSEKFTLLKKTSILCQTWGGAMKIVDAPIYDMKTTSV